MANATNVCMSFLQKLRMHEQNNIQKVSLFIARKHDFDSNQAAHSFQCVCVATPEFWMGAATTPNRKRWEKTVKGKAWKCESLMQSTHLSELYDHHLAKPKRCYCTFQLKQSILFRNQCNTPASPLSNSSTMCAIFGWKLVLLLNVQNSMRR